MEQLKHDLMKVDEFISKVTKGAEMVRGVRNPNAYTGENRKQRRERERKEAKAARREKVA